MQRILIGLLTVSLFLMQQGRLHAQSDSTSPEDSSPETEEMIEETTEEVPEESVEDQVEEPVGEAAPVEESSNSSSGGSGGGAVIAIAAVAAVVVLANKRNKLEKTWVHDEVTGTALTSYTNIENKKLNWGIDFGSLSVGLGSNDSLNGNHETRNLLNQQQLLNWRVNRAWANDWNTVASVGFSQRFGVKSDIDLRQWFSLGLHKSNIFNANDRFSLSIGQRFKEGNSYSSDGYFLPTTFNSLKNAELFDLTKNTVESGRYINVAYIRSLGVNTAFNWQLQYSPQQVDDSYVTLSWQYRF